MKRHLAIFFLALIALLGIGKLSERKTDGFTLQKIRNNFAFELNRNSTLTPEIQAILNQPFTYFKRGAQSFVFESKDGKWVVKVFNNRLKKQLFWMQLLPFSFSKESLYTQKWNEMFESYAIAADLVPEETGVIFAHLTPNQDWSHTLTLLDASRREHSISSDECGFLIQRKGKMIYPQIDALMKEGKTEDAKNTIDALISHIKRCHAHGVANHDPSIRKNVGLIDSTCLTLDVGRFAIDENLKDPTISQEETKRTLRRFRKWLVKKHPILVQELKTQGY